MEFSKCLSVGGEVRGCATKKKVCLREPPLHEVPVVIVNDVGNFKTKKGQIEKEREIE